MYHFQILADAHAHKIDFPVRRPLSLPVGDKVIEWDGNVQYANVEDVYNWLYNADLDTYYPDHEKRWNDLFWEHPAPLYHATTEENAASILIHGLRQENRTRGISNRSVGHAIFTTSEYEETVQGSYGEVVFEIDTERLAADPGRPFAEREPDIVACELRNALAHQLGMEEFCAEEEGGMSPSTVILYGPVAPQYLTRLE